MVKETTLYHDERLWFFGALALLILSFCAYIYLLSASVVHVVMRKEVDREIASVSTVVSELESSYIEGQHAISEEIATMHGYTKATEKIFIDRSADTLVLSR